MKRLKKIFSILVIISLFIQTSLISSANGVEKANNTSSNVSIKNYDINTYKKAIEGDPKVSNIQLKDNTLTYTIDKKTDVVVIESLDENGNKNLLINEGGKIDEISINETSGNIYLNEKKVDLSNPIAMMPFSDAGPSIGGSNYGWIYAGISYPNITAEREIRSLSCSVLATLISAVFGGVVGLVISVASSIITCAGNIMSPTHTVYVKRITYFEEHYWAYKYEDSYYLNSNYTGYVTTDTHEHWQ